MYLCAYFSLVSSLCWYLYYVKTCVFYDRFVGKKAASPQLMFPCAAYGSAILLAICLSNCSNACEFKLVHLSQSERDGGRERKRETNKVLGYFVWLCWLARSCYYYGNRVVMGRDEMGTERNRLAPSPLPSLTFFSLFLFRVINVFPIAAVIRAVAFLPFFCCPYCLDF